MNKDTLLEEVRKAELALNLIERYGDIDNSLTDDMWHLIDCINKLDEPETDCTISELVKENKMLSERIDNLVKKLNDKVDKTETNVDSFKPVIPQFVADYIEECKHILLTMNEWFSFDNDYENEDKTAKWLYDNDYETNSRREFTLIDAIRHGYEVDKEKNYEVIIGEGSWGGFPSLIVLYKSIVGFMVLREMTVSEYEDSKRRAPTSFWLTEKEIKSYDKRYWAFAEEVTE